MSRDRKPPIRLLPDGTSWVPAWVLEQDVPEGWILVWEEKLNDYEAAAAALEDEWALNHDERCSNVEGMPGFPPHPPGKSCYHPWPDVLRRLRDKVPADV